MRQGINKTRNVLEEDSRINSVRMDGDTGTEEAIFRAMTDRVDDEMIEDFEEMGLDVSGIKNLGFETQIIVK